MSNEGNWGSPLVLSSEGSAENRCGYRAAAADFEATEVFVPIAVGDVRIGLFPGVELNQLFHSDFTLLGALPEMLPRASGTRVPLGFASSEESVGP